MNKKILSALINRAKALWKEKRPFKKRLLCAAAAMVGACFTFLFFGPLEMVAFAADSLDYGYQDVVLPLSLLAGGVFLAATPLIALLQGKIFNYAVSTIFGATVCGYLQAALMNGNFGLLNGESIDWAASKGGMVINLLIWGVVFAVIFFVMYLHKKFWRKMVTYLSILLVIMQLVPTIGILAGSYKGAEEKASPEYFMSKNGLNQYSAEENVFVFVLDYTDYQYIENIRAEDPDFFDRLDGFIGYTDAIPNFSRTHPALNAILTGCLDLPYRVDKDEFYTDSWSDGGNQLIQTLKDLDYSVELFASRAHLFSNEEDAKKIGNYNTGKGMIKNNVLLKKLINFSAYRYSPIALKPFFWADTNYYNADIFQDKTIYYSAQNIHTAAFESATAERKAGSFKFYHFDGAHPPCKLNEAGEPSATPTTAEQATMGGFNLLMKAFDRMKELGIYEDATIIITADHGNAGTLVGDALTPMKIGLFYKPSGSAETPLTWSAAQVSTANIPATIIKAVGGDYSSFGTPLDEIEEGEAVKRVFYRSIMNVTDWNDEKIQVYEIEGSGDVFENWVKVEEFLIPEENKLYS